MSCALNVVQSNLLKQQQGTAIQQQQLHQQPQQPPSCCHQTNNPPPPYPQQTQVSLQLPQPTTIAGMVNPTLQQLGLNVQSSQHQQEQLSFSHTIKMEPQSLDVSPASVATSSSFSSDLSDISDDGGLRQYTTLTPPSSASHIHSAGLGVGSKLLKAKCDTLLQEI